MSISKTIQFDQGRVNPQFVGISEKYSTTKKERQNISRKKRYIQNSFNHLEKANDTLEVSLNRKRHELNYLKSVRERYLQDVRHKMQQDELRKLKLEELRSRSDNARKSHHKNLYDAISSKYNEKKRAHDEVCEQINNIKRSKVEQMNQMSQIYAIRNQQLKQEREMGKNKINKFFRQRNKLLLTSYRSMIREQQIQTKKSVQKINFIETQSEELKKKMKRKQDKLKQIENEIDNYRMTSLDLKNMGVEEENYNSRISGISQFSKSSHPSKILLSPSHSKSIGKEKKKFKKKKFERHMKTFQLTQLSQPTQNNEDLSHYQAETQKSSTKVGDNS